MQTVFIMHSDYLAHHGIKNQKWGQRRFQNYDGSLTSEGRKRYGVGTSNKTRKEKRVAEKAKKQREKVIKEKRKVETTAEKMVANRQKRMDYLRDHPEKIYKYRKELTESDVDTIMKNVEFDRKLKNIRRTEIQNGLKKIQDFKNTVDTINNVYQTSKSTYNNIAEVNNALVDMGVFKNGTRMRKWGEDDESFLRRDRDKKKKAEDEAFEKKLRSEEFEDIYKNRDKYSTDELNKAFKRKQIENLLKSQVEANKKETVVKDNSQKKDTISDAVREAAYSNSPTKIMKAMSGANSAEKALLEKQLEEYENVVELMRKYR